MRNFWARRIQGLLISIAVVAALWWLFDVYDMAFRNVDWLSGWTLTLLMALLIVYNVRKKISFLPMGSNSRWLQLHLYTGLVTVFVFLIHIDWRWPSGRIEFALAAVFALVSASGVAGIVMNRYFSKQLTLLGEQLLFERIPAFSLQIKAAAENLVRESIEATESTTLGDFYIKTLAQFFAPPRFSFENLLRSNRRFQRLRNALHAQERYMNDQEKEFSTQMDQLLTQKNQLERQYVLQKTLKGWLFFHLPLSYSLVLILLAHIVLVYGFGAV